jgi:hypothetical protein
MAIDLTDNPPAKGPAKAIPYAGVVLAVQPRSPSLLQPTLNEPAARSLFVIALVHAFGIALVHAFGIAADLNSATATDSTYAGMDPHALLSAAPVMPYTTRLATIKPSS